MSINAVILPYDEDSNKYRKQLMEGLKTVDGIEPVPGKWNPISPLLWSVYFTDTRPDVIHIHWIHLFFLGDNILETLLKLVRFPIELLLLRLTGVRIVWTVHNLQEHDRQFPRIELFYRIVAAHLVSELIVHCKRARDVVVDQYRLSEAHLDNIHVIPHGHYIDVYENSTTPEEARNELDIDDKSDVYLCFGQIRPYKCVPYLIDEFKYINSVNAKLLIAGKANSDSIRDEILRNAEGDDRIYTTLDFIPEEEIQTYMNAADVVVLPYRDILTSGTAILAMSFKRPVIAPAIKCLPELLNQQEILLFDPSSDNALRDALQRGLDVDTKLLGEKNYERVKAFDWGTIAIKTARVYKGKY